MEKRKDALDTIREIGYNVYSQLLERFICLLCYAANLAKVEQCLWVE